jgi:hypothetical protein
MNDIQVALELWKILRTVEKPNPMTRTQTREEELDLYRKCLAAVREGTDTPQ